MNTGEDPNQTTTTSSTDRVVASTTAFDGSEAPVMTEMSTLVSIPKSMTDLAFRKNNDQIHAFLEKPFLIRSGTFASLTPGAIITNINLPEALLNQNVYAQKIAGFQFFKATMIVRVQVNANAFTSGRLIGTFTPHMAGGTMPIARRRSLKSLTHLPKIELDLATQDEMIMEIPYVSPYLAYAIGSGTSSSSAGAFFLNAYAPMRFVAGTGAVAYSIYVSFKDVELGAPDIIPQMGKGKVKKSISETELEVQKDGVISGPLYIVSKSLGLLSGIPLISAYSEPASWVANCLAGAAKSFGFSKPTSQEPLKQVTIGNVSNLPNADGVDYSQKMSLFVNNSLTPLPGFAGSNRDEACFKSLLTKFIHYKSIAWDASQIIETSFIADAIYPMVNYSTRVENTFTIYDPSIQYAIGNAFALYRGSMVLRMKITKTKYHTGRLMLTFRPNTNSGSTYPEIERVTLLREIIDISTGEEWTFVLPYISQTPYKRNTRIVTNGRDAIGLLNIYVINTLEHPSSCADTVDIDLELSCADDFEFASPQQITQMPYLPTSSISPQMNDGSGSYPVLGGAIVGTPTLAPAEYCIGEKVNSIYTLIKRPNYRSLTTLASGPNGTYRFRAFLHTAIVQGETPATRTYPVPDVVDYFATMFATSRGSMRYKFVFNSLSYQDVAAFPAVSTFYVNYTTPYNVQDSRYTNVPIATRGINSTGALEIEIPMYTQTHMMMNRVCSNAYNPDVQNTPDMSRMYVFLRGSGVVVTDMAPYRSVGDDYMLGYFLGPLELIDTTTSLFQ